MTTPRNLSDITLKHGLHDSPEDGMCAMEAIAWLMGEKHTDFPKCVPRAISQAFQRVNDCDEWESDASRTEFLFPFLTRLMNCVDCDGAPAEAYGFAAADLAVRVFAAGTLGGDEGEKLRSLPVIVDGKSALIAASAASAAAASASYASAAASASYASAASYAAAASANANAYAYAASAASYATASAANAASSAHAASYASYAAANAYAAKKSYAQLLTRLLDVHEAGCWPLLADSDQ